jgi:hypothetical protein
MDEDVEANRSESMQKSQIYPKFKISLHKDSELRLGSPLAWTAPLLATAPVMDA